MKTIPGGATILTVEDLKHYKAPIPQAWLDAFGMWKDKPVDAKKLRQETNRGWEKRLKRQIRLGQPRKAK